MWDCPSDLVGVERGFHNSLPQGERKWPFPRQQSHKASIRPENGQVFKFWSQMEDGTGFHGLYLEAMGALPAVLASDDPLSIFRSRSLPELPVGAIEIAELRQDGPNATVGVRLMVAGVEVRLVAGEVYEQHDGSLRVIEPDESILLQVNGTWPPKH